MKAVCKLGHWLYGLFAAIGLLAVLVTCTPVVCWWAHVYSGPITQPKGDVIIVLAAANDDEGMVSYSSYWRARYALLAWQTGGYKKIAISGGNGPGILEFLMANGVPRDAMIAEWQSTSTRENGLQTARLIQNVPGKKVLLTSDFHMFRALRVFRKLGMDVAPMPAPDATKNAENWYGRIPAFETMLVETAKIVGYTLHGWL